MSEAQDEPGLVRLRIDDPERFAELRQHLQRAGFITNRISEHTVEVWRPGTGGSKQARREIEARLDEWRPAHEGVLAELAE